MSVAGKGVRLSPWTSTSPSCASTRPAIIRGSSGIALVVAIYLLGYQETFGPGGTADHGRPEHPGEHQAGAVPGRTAPGRHGQPGAPRLDPAGEQAELPRR